PLVDCRASVTVRCYTSVSIASVIASARLAPRSPARRLGPGRFRGGGSTRRPLGLQRAPELLPEAIERLGDVAVGVDPVGQARGPQRREAFVDQLAELAELGVAAVAERQHRIPEARQRSALRRRELRCDGPGSVGWAAVAA